MKVLGSLLFVCALSRVACKKGTQACAKQGISARAVHEEGNMKIQINCPSVSAQNVGNPRNIMRVSLPLDG